MPRSFPMSFSTALMQLMASNELYDDKVAFDKALEEYSALKPKIAKLEDEWLEISTIIEEKSAEFTAKLSAGGQR